MSCWHGKNGGSQADNRKDRGSGCGPFCMRGIRAGHAQGMRKGIASNDARGKGSGGARLNRSPMRRPRPGVLACDDARAQSRGERLLLQREAGRGEKAGRLCSCAVVAMLVDTRRKKRRQCKECVWVTYPHAHAGGMMYARRPVKGCSFFYFFDFFGRAAGK